ncbi:hypothetical protein GCM10011584_34750 [Nocardioides phosphati]|uniref:DUF559 domain-containing protein n=1 Tax=Nocardioides phosphati TaxID=1867775 RepID=A0ABQ2NEJ9_9ACTN|nr:hypothetical protein GCM10011584_34750 [Nocardioides phosphati]
MREAAAFDPRRPFTRAEGRAAGLTDKVLGGPRFSRLLHGVYVDARIARTPELVGLALLLGTPGEAWVSHASAARILGLPLPALPGEHVSVVAKPDRTKRRDVRSHVGDPSAPVIRRGDLVHSAPVQVFVELAEQLTLVDLVVVGDWLVRRELVTLARLRQFVGTSRLKGAAAARVAVAFVRERVDSPMETRLRMLFVLAGFPEPAVNLTVDAGNGRCRYDLCWPDVKVVAEYDGRHHAQREEQWEADLERRELIDDDGWRIRVFVANDLYNTPHLTVERMGRLLRAAGLRDMPRVLRDDWRAHFPVRHGYL